MIYCYRFSKPYETVSKNFIYEIKASGHTELDAEDNAIALINSCEFLTQETKASMVSDLVWIKPTTCYAVFGM